MVSQVEEYKRKILNNKYFLFEKIGYGASSKVYFGKKIEDVCEEVAIKVLRSNNHNLLKYFENEIEALNALSSAEKSNIINLIESGTEGSIITEDRIKKKSYLVLEYASKGTLISYLLRNKKVVPFDELYARYIFREILFGVDRYFSLDYANRDLKLENILINKDYDVRIADFGFATRSNETDEKLGTKAYFPPELWRKVLYEPKKVDIFLLGIILFKLVTGYSPYSRDSKDGDPLYRYIVKKDYEKYWESIENRYAIRLSEEIKELIQRMIDKNPSSRPYINEIYESAFMKKEIITKEMMILEFKRREDMNEELITLEEIEGESDTINQGHINYRDESEEGNIFNENTKIKKFKGDKKSLKNKFFFELKTRNPVNTMNKLYKELHQNPSLGTEDDGKIEIDSNGEEMKIRAKIKINSDIMTIGIIQLKEINEGSYILEITSDFGEYEDLLKLYNKINEIAEKISLVKS